jgi:methionyl-tRNA formyltransferase
MKVVILTTDQGNQVALCHKLMPHCEVVAIVLSKNSPRRPKPLRQRLYTLANRASGHFLGRPLLAAWVQMQQAYRDRYPSVPNVPTIHVENVNDAETLKILTQHRPDLIVVSGTNLVSRKLLESAPRKSRFVNLHTGISPYMKGAPNCTNWCLAEKSFHLIGNTVMWLDPGIDSGNIIATEQTMLDGRENLFEVHWKVMEHAHDLYSRVIRRLAKGEKLPSVPQEDIGGGRTFYSAEWNGFVAHRAMRNFERHYSQFFQNPNAQQSLRQTLRLVQLESE